MKYFLGIFLFAVTIIQAQTSCINYSQINTETRFVLVVDVSGSMSGQPLQDAKAGLKTFVNKMESSDLASLISFNTSVTVSCQMTNKKEDLSEVIDALEAGGGTHIYDAVAKAVEMCKGYEENSAVVLFTDGQDGGSMFTPKQIESMIGYHGSAFYAIGLGQIDKKALRSLAGKASGEFEFASSSNVLKELYKKTMNIYKTKHVNNFSKTSQIQVHSMPANKIVHIDGEILGRTPLKISNISPGEHEISVVFDSGKWNCESTMQAGMLGELIAIESEVTKNIAILSIPHGSAVFLDDDFQGYTSDVGARATKKKTGLIFKRTKSTPDYSRELIIKHVPIGKHVLTIVPFANSEISSAFSSVKFPFVMGKDNLIISVDALKDETDLQVTTEDLVPKKGRFKLDQSTIFDDF
jgi:uncharacterized protein YegL